MAMAMMRYVSGSSWRVSDLLEKPDWVGDAVRWSQEFAEPLAEKFGLSAIFVPVFMKTPVP